MSVQIKKDEARDALTADIVFQGRHGVAQIRAVVPLGPIREALQQELAQRGVDVPAMMGHDYLGQACERQVTQLAGIGMLHTIAGAAHAPGAKQRAHRHRMRSKVHQLVQMHGTGMLEQMGGWPAVAQAAQRKHAVHARALQARGIPDHVIQGCIQRMAGEDLAAIRHAAHIVGEDGVGSIFSSVENVVKKAAGGVKSAAKKAAGAASTAFKYSQKLSPSQYLLNKVTGGKASAYNPANIIANKFAPGGGSFRAPTTSPQFPPGGFRGQSTGVNPFANQGPASGPSIGPDSFAAQQAQAQQDAGVPDADTQVNYDGPMTEEAQMPEAQDGGPSPEDDGGPPIDATNPGAF